jgi:hypothetical protein
MTRPPNPETPRELVAARRPESDDPFGDGSNSILIGSMKVVQFMRLVNAAVFLRRKGSVNVGSER